MIDSYAARNDPYFLRNGFETSGKYSFPLIKRQEVSLEKIALIPYNLTKSNDIKNADCGVHFFIDDYRFFGVYDFPEKAFARICGYKFLLSPDFSLYKEMPMWKLIENIGKSRWCGAYWQSKGKTVIPTISWEGSESFSIAAEGIEKGCVIAVSTVGCKNAKFDFLRGYNSVLEKIEPPKIICLGEPFKEMRGDIVCIGYSRTKKISTRKTVFANTDLRKASVPFLPFEEFWNPVDLIS